MKDTTLVNVLHVADVTCECSGTACTGQDDVVTCSGNNTFFPSSCGMLMHYHKTSLILFLCYWPGWPGWPGSHDWPE